MNLKSSRKANQNLKIVSLCSKVKRIELSYSKESSISEVKRLFRNRNYVDYLKELFLQESINHPEISQRNINSIEDIVVDDLYDFKIPDSAIIPLKFQKLTKKHQKESHNIKMCEKILKEFEELEGKINDGPNLDEINSYLNNPEHSITFKNFSKNMFQENSFILLNRYKKRAAELASRIGLIIDKDFEERLQNTFEYSKLDIYGVKKQLNRTSFKLAGKIAGKIAAAFAAGAILAGTTSGCAVQQEPKNQESSTNSISDNSSINEWPLETNVKINSVNTAYKDMFSKIEKIYKHNTGKEKSLSYYGEENIGTAQTTIITATFNGKTLRFSTMGTIDDSKYLKEALETIGAEINEESDNIAFITPDGEQSIAITDSQGNPVKSGRVLDGYIYNQRYIQAITKSLEKAGIDTSAMSEAELMGNFLFSDEYKVQDDELSKALGTIYPLVKYADHFNYSPDSYTLDSYENKTNKFANEFNTFVQQKNKSFYESHDIAADNKVDYER